MTMRRRRHTMPQLNTTSTADISFMLLTFFLVTTSMDVDKGVQRQLPPKQPKQEQTQTAEAAERNVMELHINADGSLTADGQPLPLSEAESRVEEFVGNPQNLPTLPEKTVRQVAGIGKTEVCDRHVITISAEPDAPYDTYFQLQNHISQAYRTLRDRLAQRLYHRNYDSLTPERRDAIKECLPQRVSESYSSADVAAASGDATAAPAQPEGNTQGKGGAQ